MGESTLSMIGGPTIIIVILGILLWRGHQRSARLKELQFCEEQFATIDHDVKVAEALLAQEGQTSWIDLCKRLAFHGGNSVLQHLNEVTSEPQAKDQFLTHKAYLEKLLDEAKIQLEVAVSYFPTEEA